MRLFFGALILAVLSCGVSAPTAKADDYTFAFIFATTSGDYVGSGTFEAATPVSTLPDGESCPQPALCVFSLQGQVNGIPMTLGPYSEMDYTGTMPPVPGVPLIEYSQFNFLYGGIQFTIDGQSFDLFDNDIGGGALPAGIILDGPGGFEALSTLTIIPEAAAEPETLTLLVASLFGLVLFGAFAKSRGSTPLA
jgi:hypothetical protein